MDKLSYNMCVPELKKSIDLKEKEYREAIKAKKLFWEVKLIFDEKRKLERQLEIETTKHVR